MKEDMGWKFPPTGGGEEQGYNHPATEFYKGDPYKSLARETVQNSLDARASHDKPVKIVFELVKPKNGGLQALRDLKPVLETCTEELKGHHKGAQDFEEANQKIEHSDYLCIRDYNTSGLKPDLWEALVKQQGTSRKQEGTSGASNEASGGSFGIGKNATLAVSKPRTVFYWSRHREDETSHAFCERFQGKAVLVSHGTPEERRQGIGYYGLKDNCQPLENIAAIPSFFRHGRNPNGDLEPGLALWIAGFEKKNEWRREIASAILANFFLAIHEKKLEATIEIETEPEDLADDESDNYCFIEPDKLPELFEILGKKDKSVKRSKIDWELMTRDDDEDGVKIIREEMPGFGMCELRVHVHKDGDKRVSFLRAGMLITREQERLKLFRDMDNFYATFRCLDLSGNEILRSMENPAHNQFERDRLKDGDPSKKQFDALTRWIREKIKEVAGRKLESNVGENVRELAEFFPDPDRDSDDGFPGGGLKDGPEASLGGRQRITPLPSRKPKHYAEGTEPTEEDNKEGNLPGETLYSDLTNSGPANSAKDAENETHDDGGNTPPDSWEDDMKNRKETPGKSGFPVHDIRFVSMEGDTRCHLIHFTPKKTGVIGALSLSLAGDAGDFKIEVQTSALPQEVEKGKRYCIKIRTAEPLPGVAKIVEFFYAV